jgi:hypothetical protein
MTRSKFCPGSRSRIVALIFWLIFSNFVYSESLTQSSSHRQVGEVRGSRDCMDADGMDPDGIDADADDPLGSDIKDESTADKVAAAYVVSQYPGARGVIAGRLRAKGCKGEGLKSDDQDPTDLSLEPEMLYEPEIHKFMSRTSALSLTDTDSQRRARPLALPRHAGLIDPYPYSYKSPW